MSYVLPRNHGCRISDAWTYHGMPAIVLENELLRVVVLPGRGSDIVEFRYKPLDLDFLLQRPEHVRNPQHGLPSAPSPNPFVDHYTGGWNDVLPNGGPYAVYQGAALGQHGEISLVPWEWSIVEDSPARVAVHLWVRTLRTPFFVEKTLSLEPGRAILAVEERVTNEAGEPLHLMWGQHIAFGGPFLEEGAVIDAPAGRLIVGGEEPGYEPRRFRPGIQAPWPRVPAPDDTPVDASVIPAHGAAQAQEMAYLTDLSAGWYAITNPVRAAGFGMSFDPGLFRFIWLWEQLGEAGRGFPWWSRLHTVALEPWTSYPTAGLPEAVSNGTAVLLQPGASLQARFRAAAYAGLRRVHEVTAEGEVRGEQA